MYYSKCHGKLPLPGIFRFPANCHAPSVLLLLLVAEGIYGFAKGSVNFTIGKLIDELKAFERFVRLVGGRRNIYVWLLDVYDCDRRTNARSPADPSRF